MYPREFFHKQESLRHDLMLGLFFFHVHVCLHMCMRVHIYIRAGGGSQSWCQVTFSALFVKTGSPTESEAWWLWLDWLARLSEAPVSISQVLAFQVAVMSSLLLWGSWGSELCSSFLCDNCFARQPPLQPWTLNLRSFCLSLLSFRITGFHDYTKVCWSWSFLVVHLINPGNMGSLYSFSMPQFLPL